MTDLKVKNYEQYRKNVSTSSVINTNIHAFNAYKKRKQALNNIEKKKDNEIQQLKNELAELKELIKGITNG